MIQTTAQILKQRLLKKPIAECFDDNICGLMQVFPKYDRQSNSYFKFPYCPCDEWEVENVDECCKGTGQIGFLKSGDCAIGYFEAIQRNRFAEKCKFDKNKIVDFFAMRFIYVFKKECINVECCNISDRIANYLRTCFEVDLKKSDCNNTDLSSLCNIGITSIELSNVFAEIDPNVNTIFGKYTPRFFEQLFCEKYIVGSISFDVKVTATRPDLDTNPFIKNNTNDNNDCK